MDYYENCGSFSKVTNNIEVVVISKFHPDESKKDQNKFFWFYNIQIRNLSNFLVQIMDRHWQIYDNNGTLLEVKEKG